MKKFMTLALAMTMVLALAGCGNSASSGGSTGGSSEGSGSEAGAFVPSKNVTWICTSSAGGGSDIFTRKISDIMSAQSLVNGQTIVVSNETEGSGEVGRNKAAPMKNNTTYTLLTFNYVDLTPMVTNTKNTAENF